MSKKTWNYIFGAILILFGIIFIISPQGTFETIVLAGGIILIMYAVIGIITAIISKNPYVSYSIGNFIIGLIFGIILITNTEGAVKLIPILLGIWLFITGLSTLIFTLKVTKDLKTLVTPITKTVLGIIAFALPVIPVIATGIFIGIILVLAGVTTIVNNKTEEVVYKVKVKK